jgi:hypothetical protein
MSNFDPKYSLTGDEFLDFLSWCEVQGIDFEENKQEQEPEEENQNDYNDENNNDDILKKERKR